MVNTQSSMRHQMVSVGFFNVHVGCGAAGGVRFRFVLCNVVANAVVCFLTCCYAVGFKNEFITPFRMLPLAPLPVHRTPSDRGTPDLDGSTSSAASALRLSRVSRPPRPDLCASRQKRMPLMSRLALVYTQCIRLRVHELRERAGNSTRRNGLQQSCAAGHLALERRWHRNRILCSVGGFGSLLFPTGTAARQLA